MQIHELTQYNLFFVMIVKFTMPYTFVYRLRKFRACCDEESNKFIYSNLRSDPSHIRTRCQLGAIKLRKCISVSYGVTITRGGGVLLVLNNIVFNMYVYIRY